jgi:hypothetical protein
MPKDRAGPTPSATTAGSTGGGAKSEITTQMEDVLQLLNQRMEGQVSTIQVESAVSDLLSAMGARKSESATATATATAKPNEITKKTAAVAVTRKNNEQQPTSSIQGDMGNYDDSSDDDHEVEEKAGAPSSSLKQSQKKKRRIGESNNENSGKQNSPNEKYNKSFPVSLGFADEDEYRDAVSLIPMGKEAAKMMTTFGDGPHPLPDSLELALMGTRKALQVSIMDARKVRRRLQKDYRDAQSIIMKYNPNKYKTSDKSNPTVAAATAWVAEQDQQQSAPTPIKNNDSSPTATPSESNGNSDGESGDESGKNETTTLVTPSKNQKPSTAAAAAATPPPTANSIDPRLVYRALAEGTDKLSYAHKCGFHMEELSHLYPEEMMAYHRWNEMHEEYSESKADDGAENDGSNNKNPNKTNDDEAKETYGGHLRERAANFDYRTDQMKNDWYVEYAKVRQGSFLPSSRRVKRTKTEIEWDRLRRIKKGRHAAGEWENISGRAVRFLHWLGFDPPNLFPPDEETTQALAFLTYDRFGRIVEKAIFLRNETDEGALSLWELRPGEQLSVRDIERALEDPDIKPATVYGTEDSKASSSIQLYFGPGWEDRLELEMEE